MNPSNRTTQDDDDDDYDSDDSDNAETLPCPHCGTPIFEEAERCPACGEYVTFSTNPFAGRSALWVGLGVAGIVALLAVLLFGR